MVKYIVFVTIKSGIDDTYYCEYSGIEHSTKGDAVKEAQRALYKDDILNVTIEQRN